MHLNCSYCGASLVGQSPHEHNGRWFCDSVCVSLAYPEEYKTEDETEDQQSKEDLIRHKFRSQQDRGELVFLQSLPPGFEPNQNATSDKDEKPPIPFPVFFGSLKAALKA